MDKATLRRAARPKVFVASRDDHNAGVLSGEWIDAAQDDLDVELAIALILALAKTNDEAEDWVILDYDGFGQYRVKRDEWIEDVSAVARGIVEYGEAYAAWVNECDPEYVNDHAGFLASYAGAWPGLAEFAAQEWAECGYPSLSYEDIGGASEHIRVDYESFGKALLSEGHIEIAYHDHGVWVFRTHR